MRGRIDVHHHLIPDFYRRALRDAGIREAGGRQPPNWDVEGALKLMDLIGTRTAIVSISTPRVGFIQQADRAAELARELNEFTATMRTERPDRFGFFATLPMPDIQASVAEAERALDERGGDGVVLLANNRGVYLGTGGQDPLFRALEDRVAVVFIHPAELPGPAVDGIVPFAADFLLDTTRAAYLLVRNRVVSRYPNIRFILSHAGGFVPYASHRMVGRDRRRDRQDAPRSARGLPKLLLRHPPLIQSRCAADPARVRPPRPHRVRLRLAVRTHPGRAVLRQWSRPTQPRPTDPRRDQSAQRGSAVQAERPARHRRREARPRAHASPARRFSAPSPEQPSKSYNRAEAIRPLTSGQSERPQIPPSPGTRSQTHVVSR
jgi:predicted TIM-barrel fold metal-dependent hydrolase